MIKLMHNILIGIVLILTVLITVRNIIIRFGIEHYMRTVTGLKLSIGMLDIGILQPAVSIKDLKLYNPAGYEDPVMADVGEIYFHYSPGDMLKGQIYLQELHFTLNSLSILRHSGNQLNFDALKG